MKKEQKYKICLNGNPHEIFFAQSRTKYELYVDGSLACQINKTDYDGNAEKDVVIDSKVCQFVVYGDDPDLAVDGILQAADAQEKKSRRFHKHVLLGLGAIQVLIGTFCFFTWFMLQAADMYVIGGPISPVMSALFAIAGVVEMICGLRIHVD